MGSDIGKCGILGQILLVIFNILFIILGIIAIAIGAWAIASGNNFGFVTGSAVIGGSAVLIIVGCAIIVIAAVGLFGAMCKVRPLLIIYAIVVLIIVIVEIAAGIAAIVYRDTIATSLLRFAEDDLIGAYDTQMPSSDVNTIVDLIQTTFRCCGVNNASDWVTLNPDAISQSPGGRPPNCLMCTIGEDNCQTFYYNVTASNQTELRNFNTTNVGCASETIDENDLLRLAIGAGVVGIIFGLFEIAGIVIALLLCCCIHRAHKQTVV